MGPIKCGIEDDFGGKSFSKNLPNKLLMKHSTRLNNIINNILIHFST